MTNRQYSEDDLRKAWANYWPSVPANKRNFEEFMTKLSKSKQSFREGELLIHQRKEYECIKVRKHDAMKYLNYRHLTYNELPQYVHDFLYEVVEAECMASSDGYSFSDIQEILYEALTAFDAASERGEG